MNRLARSALGFGVLVLIMTAAMKLLCDNAGALPRYTRSGPMLEISRLEWRAVSFYSIRRTVQFKLQRIGTNEGYSVFDEMVACIARLRTIKLRPVTHKTAFL